MKSPLFPTEALSFVATLIGMAAAGLALKEAAETAVHLIPVQWYSRAHGLVQLAGLDRITCLLGCLGLCLALLCVACAAAMPTLARRKTIPSLETAGIGLSIFLGCGISGSLLGLTSAALTAWGLRGFCVFAVIFALILLFMNKWHIAETPSRMLVLHTVTLLTMYLGVWSGWAMDISKPRLGFLNILLAPATCIMGLLVATFMLRRHRECLILIFVLLVPFSGLVFGFGIARHRGEEPLLHHTYITIQGLVYTLEILTGILGTVSGIYVSLWDPGRAGRLSFWISVPAVAALYALAVDNPHTNLPSVAQQGVGTAGVLGLISGLAAASGVALGLAIVSAGVLYLGGVPVLGPEGVGDMSFNPRPAAEGVLVDAVVNLAFLGVVMMGSAVLGVAGFLTASLGSLGLRGIVLAGVIILLKAVHLLSE